MKAKVNSIYCSLISFLLALLGFAGCTSSCTPHDEYGMPSAKYKVRGTVLDEEVKAPVKGLRAVLYNGDSRYIEADTVYTGADGGFDLELERTWSNNLFLKIEDIDGGENGGPYKEKEFELDFSGIKASGGKGWYEGEKTLELGNIHVSLQEEETIEEE